MPIENPCHFFTNTGGCINHEKAGEDAKVTPDVIGQPWSCGLVGTTMQQRCSGFGKKESVSTVTDLQIKK